MCFYAKQQATKIRLQCCSALVPACHWPFVPKLKCSSFARCSKVLELKIAQAENCKAMPMLEALQNLGLAQQARIRCKASDQLI
jgi:hypothetical protein